MIPDHDFSTQNASTRRHFLRSAGLGAAVLAVARHGAAQAAAPGGEPADKPPGKCPFALGLASYTLRKFSLDEALAMMERGEIKDSKTALALCLTERHLKAKKP